MAEPTTSPAPAGAVPRGVRNRNPLNIDFHEKNRWIGQVGREEGSGRFAKFDSFVNGIRAAAHLIALTYGDRYGLKTIRGIVNRWAPPVENATGSYIQRVEQLSGFGRDQVLDLHDVETMLRLVRAMAVVEITQRGVDMVPESAWRAGIEAALRRQPAIAGTGTVRAAAGVGAAGSVAVITQAATTAAPALGALKDLAVPVALALILVTVLGFVWLRWRERREVGA